jgi:hypothetical protein
MLPVRQTAAYVGSIGLKNIARLVRVYRVRADCVGAPIAGGKRVVREAQASSPLRTRQTRSCYAVRRSERNSCAARQRGND